ncbi:hypothetical protein [Schlesneria sp. DSM 10557]|uniref:hypothetical protein n=1 Tax=Schlesneria sp. DSM 10557 TaxID=3044399 RepID=UPI0035A0CB84
MSLVLLQRLCAVLFPQVKYRQEARQQSRFSIAAYVSLRKSSWFPGRQLLLPECNVEAVHSVARSIFAEFGELRISNGTFFHEADVTVVVGMPYPEDPDDSHTQFTTALYPHGLYSIGTLDDTREIFAAENGVIYVWRLVRSSRDCPGWIELEPVACNFDDALERWLVPTVQRGETVGAKKLKWFDTEWRFVES